MLNESGLQKSGTPFTNVHTAHIPQNKDAAGAVDAVKSTLIKKGYVSAARVEEAAQQAESVASTLGTVLLRNGDITRSQLLDVIGDITSIPTMFVDNVDADVIKLFPAIGLARGNWVPVSIKETEHGKEVIVAVAGFPSNDIASKVQDVVGEATVQQFLTTDWDVRRAIRVHWGQDLAETAVNLLLTESPELSASTVITKPQKLIGLGMLVLLGLGLIFKLDWTLFALLAGVNIAFTLSVAVKQLVGVAGALNEDRIQVTDEEVALLSDDDLPMYTILVPAYKEANIVGLLMQNLEKLDYPKEKLEIILLLEEDDTETLEAARLAAPPEVVRFLVVPHAIPKTKPKACNVGLMFAQGEYTVIFDAEDRPEPDQLKKAVVAFRKGGKALVCVQAALNYFNSEENFLTRMFTLEYSSWFDYTLAGLDRLGLPIPLGGTSNHFKTSMLRELGGWDPYNVTEDADLGIRAAARGYRVQTINSTTFEEANNAYGNWLRQRSRWIKGYMQTFLVHTRSPLSLVKKVGFKQTFGFMFIIGGTPLSFLAGPLMWVLFGCTLLFPTILAGLIPHWLLVVCLFNLCLGNGLIVYLALMSVLKRRQYSLAPFALLNQVYWVMHSLSSYKALWQLAKNPFYWEKTTHGITKHQEGEQ